jgi:zinc transport system substrate-binding protein
MLHVTTIFIEPQYSNKSVAMLSKETNVVVKALDPVTTGPIEPPLNYYEKIMLNNYETLKGVLGAQ